MASGEQRIGELDQDLFLQPELLWQRDFEGGRLRVSYKAFEEYGLAPAGPAVANPNPYAMPVGMQPNHRPGVNITLLGRHEAVGGAEAVLEKPGVSGALTEAVHAIYLAKPGRIDVVMSLPVGMDDPVSDQRAFWHRLFGTQPENRVDESIDQLGVPYLVGHVVTALAQETAITAFTEYMGAYPPKAISDDAYAELLLKPAYYLEFGVDIGNAVHNAICSRPHPEDDFLAA